jgi:hypothetical protein
VRFERGTTVQVAGGPVVGRKSKVIANITLLSDYF